VVSLIHFTSANYHHPFANIAKLEGNALLGITIHNGKPLVFWIDINHGAFHLATAILDAHTEGSFKGIKPHLLTDAHEVL
jgi:hypothetical protein